LIESRRRHADFIATFIIRPGPPGIERIDFPPRQHQSPTVRS